MKDVNDDNNFFRFLKRRIVCVLLSQYSSSIPFQQGATQRNGTLHTTPLLYLNKTVLALFPRPASLLSLPKQWIHYEAFFIVVTSIDLEPPGYVVTFSMTVVPSD